MRLLARDNFRIARDPGAIAIWRLVDADRLLARNNVRLARQAPGTSADTKDRQAEKTLEQSSSAGRRIVETIQSLWRFTSFIG